MQGLFCDAPRKVPVGGGDGQGSDAKQFLAHIKGESLAPVKPAFSRAQGTKYRGEGEIAPHRAVTQKSSWFSCLGTKDPKPETATPQEEVPPEEPKAADANSEGFPTPERDHIATLKENLDSWHMEKFDEVYGVGACYPHLPKELQPAYLATPAVQAHCATFPAPDAEHISILKATPDEFHCLKFDEVYGPGAAAKQLATN